MLSMSPPGSDDSENAPHSAQLRKKCQHIGESSPHDDAEETNCQYLNCNATLETGNYLYNRDIHTFPVEILSIVFTLYAASDDRPVVPRHARFLHEIQSNCSQACPPSVILSSICRKWRNIALDLPHIWTNVTINPWKHAFSLDLTSDWLSRSRSLPLSLTIKGSSARKPPPKRPLDNLFQILRSLSRRWEVLTLDIPANFIRRLLHGLEGVDRLDILRLDATEHSSKTSGGRFDIETCIAPKEFCARGFDIESIPLEWSRLTHLDVKWMNLDDLIHIFENAIALETCVVDNVGHCGNNYDIPFDPVTNDSLKSLDTHDFEYYTNFTRHVTLPGLETLKYQISGPCANDDRAIDFFALFLERSEPSLQYFSLSYHAGEAMSCDDWFAIFPTVTHLELVVEVNVEQFIDQLKPSVLPELQELRIITSSISSEGWQRLTEIFPLDNDKETLDETSAKRPLVSLYIRLATSPTKAPIPEEVYARFVKIQASGVRVEIVGANQVDLLKAFAELHDHGPGEEINSVG